ncbi:MAG: restriction endonuclease [Bacteroidota bacterium]|nr:restriction endonuclease [Bacteroidota bacterium]
MNWRNYEHYIYYTYKNKYPTSNIEFDKKIKGAISERVRQVDLYIEGEIAGEKLVLIIDCKYFNKKIDIKIVEAFLGFVKDVKGNRGILITNKGFTKAANARAQNDQNADIKLDIIEFKQLYPFQGPGAIIHRDEGGAIIQAPEGWVVDGKRFSSEVLAAILPYGLSLENAAMMKEVIFCNITIKQSIPTIDNLIEYQDQGRLKFDSGSTVKIAEMKLKRYDKRNGICRETLYPQIGYFDWTIFIDFEKFIFYAYLVENLELKGKYFDKLFFVVNNFIPLEVFHSYSRKINSS